MRKVWIEAALNGAWGGALQPGIPDTVNTVLLNRCGSPSRRCACAGCKKAE
jgi:hypothetical protein